MLSPPAAELYRQVTRGALVGLFVNLSLGIVKLLGGIFGHSFALVSDSVNSLGDVFATCVVLTAVRIAQLPADREHPYGHSRAEAVAATNVAVMIIMSALWIGWEAISRFGEAGEPPHVWTLWISAANVLIKEFLYRYSVRLGKKTGSQAMIANAWDHRSDAFCALAVLLGLATVRWAGPEFAWADEVAALVVVAAILWTAIALFRSSANELLDVQAAPELVSEIRQLASDVPGVKEVEKLRVRKSGLEYFVDIHIQVDPQMSVADGHRVGHAVKDRLKGAKESLRDVLVHLEPHGTHEH